MIKEKNGYPVEQDGQ